MISRNALNPIWEETFDIEIHLPELAFIRFTILDVSANIVTAQRVVPVTKLRSGYRHLRLHNDVDQPLPLSQLFLCTQFLDGDLVEEDGPQGSRIPGSAGSKAASSGGSASGATETGPRKRMSFLVVHDISEHSPYAILKVPENATTRDVIRQAITKAGGGGGNEHEYVLLEEVLAPSANGEDFLTTPPTQQRMVGMDECPLHIRNRWKSDSKFVLKRVGADPSWRARLGNLMIEENSQSLLPASRRRHSTHFDALDEEVSGSEDTSGGPEKKDVDNFLVCVFNVSSKVSYSILQVPKTSNALDVITMALQKSRRGEGDEDKPEKFALVEETDPPSGNSVLNGPQGGKKGAKGKRKRVLDSSDNVYLVQLAWKGAGRLILEEKEKLLREGQLHMDFGHHNSHLNVCETHSEPLGGGFGMAGKVSPRIRRSSKIIASGVRRISRSFYGGDSSSSHVHVNLNVPHGVPARRPKQRRVTTAAAMSPSPSSLSASNASSSSVISPANGEVFSRGEAEAVVGPHLDVPGRPRRSFGGGRRRSQLTESTSLDPGVGTSDSNSPVQQRATVGGDVNGKLLVPPGEEGGGAEKTPAAGRKLSKVNLRKLKIW